jgi:hypothetical protein
MANVICDSYKGFVVLISILARQSTGEKWAVA